MERSKELSFSVRNSGEVGQPTGLGGSTPGFVGDLQLLAGEELEARLQIHDRIGGGSTARVYRGTLDGSTPVAVKVLHPHAAQREAPLQEFLREAQVLARLQHKHIVRLHALAHVPPNFAGLPTRRFTWGIITEFMESGTLTKLVQEAAKVLKQQQRLRQHAAASGLASAGGTSSAAAPDRSGSFRQLKASLSFLRRRSGTTVATTTATGGGGGVADGAPSSPRPRAFSAAAATAAGSPSGVGNGHTGGGVASRLNSASVNEVLPVLPYTDRQALRWCMELALALQFLHAQTPPIVHRDVKTDNVLMAAGPLQLLPAVSGAVPVAAPVHGSDLGTAGLGSSFTATAAGGMVSSNGSLGRRVLSLRAAATVRGGEGAACGVSRAGSATAHAQLGLTRPLTAKLCDFGLHVVLDLSRPVVTVRRRSYEAYQSDGMGGSNFGGACLPYSSSLTRPSARNSPAGGAGALAPGGTISTHGMGSPSPHGLTVMPYSGAVRYETRSRRSSLTSNRDDTNTYRRGVSRDGDSFSRFPKGRKMSYLSPGDSLDPSNSQSTAAVAAAVIHTSGPSATSVAGAGGLTVGSPPKPPPTFLNGPGNAIAAAFGTGSPRRRGIARMSSGPMAGSASGVRTSAGTYRSPKTSIPGSGPGPPKWSGGSTRALQGLHHGGFAATRASLDLLLQGHMSATAAVAVASQSAASSATSGHARGAGGSGAGVGVYGGGGGGSVGASTAPLVTLHSSLSHPLGAVGGGPGMETLSAGQMMIQLQASSTTGMSERGSRLRPFHAGPSTGDLLLPPGLSLEAALRLASSSGRPPNTNTNTAMVAAAVHPGGAGEGADAAAPAAAAAGGGGAAGAGGGGAVSTLGPMGGVPRMQRASTAGSPVGSSRGATRLRSNAAQVAQYLAMMEEDLNLDPTSRSSSKAQAEMDPLCGSSGTPFRTSSHSTFPRMGGPGPASGGHHSVSGRSLLASGHSQGHMQGASHAHALLLQGTASASRLSPSGRRIIGPPQTSGRPSPNAQALVAAAAAANANAVAAAAAAATTPRNTEQAAGRGSGGGGGSPARGAATGLPAPAGSRPATAGLTIQGADSPRQVAVAQRPASGTSTGSDALMLLTGASCSGSGSAAGGAIGTFSPTRSGAAAATNPRVSGGDGGATDSPNSGSGRKAADVSPAPQTHGPVLPSSHASRMLSGLPGRTRGPNPMKSSSQPAMSVTPSSLGTGYPTAGPGLALLRGRNPSKASSQPAMSLHLSGRAPASAVGSGGSGSGAGLMIGSGSAAGVGGSGSGGGGDGGGSGSGASHAIGERASSRAGSGGGSRTGSGGGTAPSAVRRLYPAANTSTSQVGFPGATGYGWGSAGSNAIAGQNMATSSGASGLGQQPSASSPRKPNPMKASSQPSISVVAAMASTHGAAPGPVAFINGQRMPLPRSTSNGSRAMSNLSNVIAHTPASPTASMQAADLTSPVRRIRSASRPGASGVGPPGGSIPEVDDGDGLVVQRESSLSGPGAATTSGGGGPPAAAASASAGTASGAAHPHPRRRSRVPHLEVTVPSDDCDESLLSAISSVTPGTGAQRLTGGGGSGSTTTVGGRLWATSSAAFATQRAHSASAGGGMAGSVGGASLGAASSPGMESGIGIGIHPPHHFPPPNPGAPPPPHSAGGGTGGAGPHLLNRELHKVVKRLRPDGGSFTGSGNSPLGLPPTAPLHSTGCGTAGGDGSSFTYSRRSSMDSHAPSYNSIASALSATAALHSAGGGGAGGLHGSGGGGSGSVGPSSLHREKLLWGRSLVVGSGSIGPSSGGGGGGGGSGGGGVLIPSHHSGPVPSGAFASDPNSPVGSYGPGTLGGRQGGRTTGTPVLSTVGSVGARTTSGGVSAGGYSGRQSSAGDRSARQGSLMRHSSSTNSNNVALWGEYGGPSGPSATATGCGAAAISSGASPSRANTGNNLRAAVAATGLAVSGALVTGGTAGGGACSASGHTPTALASPLLTHVMAAGSQGSSSVATRMVSESAVSSTLGGWTGRDDSSNQQGEAAYALTGRAGTLIYMAPEVIRHEPYNEKVDVFSFGVVLYEVFGRVLLLELYSKDELETLAARITSGFRHPRPETMPQAVWDLVQQCWAQNPVDRPSMPVVVRQLELAIEALDEAEGVVAGGAVASTGHRGGSLFGDGAGGGGLAGAPGSPMRALTVTGGGGGTGSGATAGKERSSGRSLASHRSLGSLGSLGRRSALGLSFRRRGSLARPQPQPTAPTPGRQPPTPYNQTAPDVAPGSALPTPTSRGSIGGVGSGGSGVEATRSGEWPPRCAPCGCVIS